ncbi:4-hydroxy-tetrahydrodipicolinate synthase [Paenibacillus sp. S-12]|uniref:4-hydroxy-tetrahydrodipicolinate synthase n=1 Tax=Paenibacillus sp. S-12 TaxID=3031371 RepID=UPI00259FE6B3|nr:4-hydroxy-tetrahydrodipicolinate synthase [Paenibacillus sp. S-12]
MDFGRLITAMVTPFNGQNEVNWPECERLINYLIEEQKSDSIVMCGTTGESPTLTDEEKVALFRFAVEKANGRARIIAGTGSNNTAHSIHLTKAAEEAGVDGILLVVPYYNRPSQEGMYRHFEAIAKSTSLPIMLYNVPGRTASSLSVETTLRLAELPNVVATKECAGLEQVSQIVAGAPGSFKVYSGEDSLSLPILSVGGYGAVSVASHIIGAQMKAMIENHLAGQHEEAARIHLELFPVFKGLFMCPNPVAVKHALQLSGFQVGSVRLPLVEPTSQEAAAIRELVQSIKK